MGAALLARLVRGPRARRQTYQDESTAWSAHVPDDGRPSQRARRSRSATLREDQQAAYRLGRPGPGSGLPGRRSSSRVALGKIVAAPSSPSPTAPLAAFEGWALQRTRRSRRRADLQPEPPPGLRSSGSSPEPATCSSSPPTASSPIWAAAWPRARADWVALGAASSTSPAGRGRALHRRREHRRHSPSTSPTTTSAGSFQVGAWGLYTQRAVHGRDGGTRRLRARRSGPIAESAFAARPRPATTPVPVLAGRLRACSGSFRRTQGNRRSATPPATGNDGEIVWYG